ncbi:hypothetical protein EV401DRAFT_1889521 [Pisolithus croceorrhizus]|nr:hypothetical protein EV401DRAFT_1889521 [Pisolithus croceorrhizus]
MPTSPKSQSPAADPALSALVDIALTSVLWGCPLTPSSVIQRSDLQRPRLRVRSQLTNLQRCLEEEVLALASFSSMELQLSALVIAFAILNPLEDVTEWDIDRFAELKRNVEDKTKYFPYPQWGFISDPATILDVHGRVVVWYLPGIMSPARVEHLNKIHLPLKDSLVKCSKTGATFQQAHTHFGRLIDPQKLEDKVYESSSLKKAPVRQWLQDISYAEELRNTIAEIVLPDLAQVVKDAISVKEDWVVTQPPSPISWPSIYLGIDIIVNQETPPHLDQVSAPSLLDLVRRSKVLQKPSGRGALYTFQPTKTRREKLTHKEVDARHLYLPSGSWPSTPRTPRTMGSSQNLDFSDFPNSLDIPNSDWSDVESPPQSRRHTKRAEYLNVILEGEQLAKGGMCHGGDPCPQNWSDADLDEAGYMTGEEPPNHGQTLFPASISKPKTAFTFDVLDHFLIDSLECKTSAMNFYQKLKRFTNNAFPERDRYRELMRISWLWRDLKHRKWFGLGHDMEQDPGDGELALFCPAFPQPDGKFTAQPMKMNKPELDVALSDGTGFMVAEVPYQSHLKQSLDSQEKGEWVPVECQLQEQGEKQPISPSSPMLWRLCLLWARFHLAVHKLSCFPRYSLNFIKGAGHLDGEILETLWAPFNKISPTARSMTQAHRKEVYDDHMRDSNWKKLVGMVPSLLKKYKNSSRCLEEMNQAYEQLTAVLDPDKVAGWELDTLRAEADRGEALDIYLLKGDKAPTFHEVWLQFMKKPKSPLEMLVQWPGFQKQEVKISEKRQRLSSRTEKFHSNGQAFCKGLEIDGTFTPQDDPAFCGTDEEEHEDGEFWDDDDDDEGDWEAPEEEVEGLASELMSIWMPSSIGAAKLTELGLHDLLKEERELRIGQANDCLDQLRTDLRNNGHAIPTKLQGCKFHQGGYQDQEGNPKGGGQERYQEILPEDLVVSKEVTEENRLGQGTSKLAWFWVMDSGKSQLNVEAGGLMEESYRINWLKARARRERWKEEVSLVRHEMFWTRLWFEYHKNMWEQRALQSTEPGKEAYARKQMVLWSDFENKASLMFQDKQMDGI